MYMYNACRYKSVLVIFRPAKVYNKRDEEKKKKPYSYLISTDCSHTVLCACVFCVFLSFFMAIALYCDYVTFVVITVGVFWGFVFFFFGLFFVWLRCVAVDFSRLICLNIMCFVTL